MKNRVYKIRSDIGGRVFEDVTQLAYSIASRVKDVYPINEVPPEVVGALVKATSCAKDLEKQFENIQKLVGYEE